MLQSGYSPKYYNTYAAESQEFFYRHFAQKFFSRILYFAKVLKGLLFSSLKY